MVPQQWLANTTAPNMNADDRRRMDLVIYGASPLGHVWCCDATMVSPLRGDGTPHGRAPDRDGDRLRTAERRKRRRYPELLQGSATRLKVLGCEVGGRWNQASGELIRDLTTLRARACPAVLRPAARAAWQRRWWALLSVAAQEALAATLLEENPLQGGPAGFDEPFLADVLEAASEVPAISRLPIRRF